MHQNRINSFTLTIGFLLVACSISLMLVHPVQAQCGSQASSCKNCHEVQGQDPVNADGKGWHTGHAFADFCYICHAGNNQAVEKDAAHVGMVPPLSDVKAACQQCHPNDLMERAQVYAVALGVEIGSGGTQPPTPLTSSSPANLNTPIPGTSSGPELPAPAGGVIVEQPTIDYVQQYNETVLNQKPINWGNIILAIMIASIAIGGGTLIVMHEKKLRRRSQPSLQGTTDEIASIHLEDYPEEVIALLPKIAALNPVGRKSLKIMLQDPDAASELLHSLSHLDPDLIRRVRSLNREEQVLLIALAGE